MTARRVNPRTVLAFCHDLVAAGVAWALAYLLRFNLDLEPPYDAALWQTMAWVVPLKALVFWRFGLYRGIWRYASLPDLKQILKAVGLAALAVPLALVMLRLSTPVPRSVLVLDPILLVFLMGGSRLAYRAWKEHRVYGLAALTGQPVLVLGAGDAALRLVKSLDHSRDWRVVGLLDDNANKHGRQIFGVPVLGTLAELPARAADLGVGHAIIAMPGASHRDRRHAVDLCHAAGVAPLTVPSFDDLMSGKVTVSELRQVEVDDLLGRDPVVLDSAGLTQLLSGRVVLVTGAGGSIGSELARQVARFAPARLVLFEASEFALYTIEQEFVSRHPEIPIACAIGDVKDAARVDAVLAAHRPQVILHAAAYKHVPLMERENAWQAVRNNVLGTLVMARAAAARGVEKFVLVSTDKAVNPTSVMGASKRLAELVCQALQAGSATRFVMVRFGNVLGSAGSVIPRFRQQIAAGGPVTVTHPDMTRYFMSIPEAAQLVLQAGLMGQGGEIYVLDMGEPVKIVDLARDLIRLSGLQEGDVEIVFTGLRPGEKLFEEVLADDEHTLPTPHPKLRIARARSASREWLAELEAWMGADARPEGEVKAGIRGWVAEYTPYPAEAGEAPAPAESAR